MSEPVCVFLCSPGNDAPILASVTETAMTTHNIEMEPGEKVAAMGASVVTYNPYRKTYRAGIHSWFETEVVENIIVNHKYTI